MNTNTITEEVEKLQGAMSDSEACERVLAALEPHLPRLQLMSLTNVGALPEAMRLHAAVAKVRARLNPP